MRMRMRMRMRMLAVLATGGAVALSMVGCASIPLGVPPVRDVAVISDTMSCADPVLGAPPPGAGLVPDDFAAVAVLECVSGASREDAEGVVAGTEVLRYEGDLSEFLEAIAAPSDPGTAVVCPAVAYGFRSIWATDAAGRFAPMSFPSTACGGPKEDEPLAALARLEVVDRLFTAGARVELSEAVAAGCATRAGVAPLALLEPAPQLSDVDALSLTEGEPADDAFSLIPGEPPRAAPHDDVIGAQVCVYRAEAGEASTETPVVVGDGGIFAGAYSLDIESTRAVLAAAAAPPVAADCAEAASHFVVVHPRTSPVGQARSPVTVELDGCQRIIGTDFQARPAPPDLITLPWR